MITAPVAITASKASKGVTTPRGKLRRNHQPHPNDQRRPFLPTQEAEDVVPADAVQFKETSTATGEGEDANDGDYDNAEKEESPDVAIIGGAVARIMFFVWGHRAISFAPLSLSERHRNTCVPPAISQSSTVPPHGTGPVPNPCAPKGILIES
jgi:hypothetical protein